MATPDQITALRPLVNDTDAPTEFSDDELSAQIDAAGDDLRRAAGVVWGIKASRLAGLADVTEGSSSRKLGSLYKQALEMASFYGVKDETTVTPTRGRSGSRPITRA